MMQPKGSGFTNIQRFLQANRSNRLPNALSGGISASAQAVKGGLQKAGQEFEQNLGQASERLGQETQFSQNLLGKVAQEPTSAQDIERFKGFTSGAFKGPEGLQDEEKLARKAEETRGLAGLTQSREGRTELLRRFAGKAGYTPAKRSLDELFIGPEGAGQLKSAKREALQSIGGVKEGIEKARMQGRTLQEDAGQKQRDIKGQLTQDIASRQQALRDRLQQKTQEEQAREGQYEDLRGSDTPTGRILRAYAASGISPEQFVSFRPGENVSLPGVASQQEGQAFEAYSQLASDPTLSLGQGVAGYRPGEFRKDEFGLAVDAENRYKQGSQAQFKADLEGGMSLPGLDPNKDVFGNLEMLRGSGNPAYSTTVRYLQDLLNQNAAKYGLPIADDTGRIPGDTGNLPGPG